MALIEDQAICVRTWDWSETSQTAVMLTREHGMIRVLAKGSKRERSAFSGGLEVCTQGGMAAIVKPSSELALMTVWDLVQPMLGVRKHLKAYHCALLGADLIPRLIQDHDPHAEVYDALYALIKFCDQVGVGGGRDVQAGEDQVEAVLAWFLWTVLVAVGAMPIVDHDVLTGDQLTQADVYGFSPQLGGITQDPITSRDESSGGTNAGGEGVWRIRAQTVEMMNALGERPGVERFLERPFDQNLRLSRLLGSYIRERVGTDIPSMKWLLGSDG
ncbi:MAG: recombination protein O N-terminal domain-containing protein [Phycisphaerales bacterium]|nr:recombination protein O N-terminal domain-containing protein [Phycisphaerales bacterium]